MICLTCRHASEKGSIHCTRCVHTLNCQKCTNGHVSRGMGKICCPDCGDTNFAPSSAAIPLGWLSHLLTAIVLLLSFKLAVMFFPTIFGITVGALNVVTGFVFGIDLYSLAYVLHGILCVGSVLWMYSLATVILPGEGGPVCKATRNLPLILARWLWRMAHKAGVLALRLLWKLVVRCFQDKPSVHKRTVKREGGDAS